ncbi:chymotrypsin-like elastase family member 2A [Ixodes scapularis]|uniref:chymotrypsin-like elastase family member 2A n=1 Tax=Ixodes scapularis TaxID=6945 RepID=UPI001A9DE7EF|nr:chymotrypsin-like elastase family member 2A [Ixodes scapularis]
MKLVIFAFLLNVVWSRKPAGCGRPSIEPFIEPEDRIYGGRVAMPGSWPWQAQLQLRGRGHICGGSLISDQHVLTAAHCVWGTRPASLKIHLGSHRRLRREPGELVVDVHEICIHPASRASLPAGLGQDIAIIKLKSKVNTTTTIQPVCLPENHEELSNTSKVFVLGWGETERSRGSPVLKQTRVQYLSNSDCRARGVTVISQIFCGGHIHGSTCRGDSGGPVVHRNGGVWSQHGIVSGGPFNCGWSYAPQFFVKVSSYVDNFIAPYINSKTSRDKIRSICRLVSS